MWSVFTGPYFVATFDERQQVALHAFARHAAAEVALARDLVDLVEEDDAVVLDRKYRLAGHLLGVEQLVRLLVEQQVVRILHRDAARLGAAAEGLAEHLADVDHADAAAGHVELRHVGRAVLDLDLDFLVVEFAVTQALPERFARRRGGGGTDQCRQNPFLRGHFGLGGDVLAATLAHQPDADLDEVADDRIHVASDIADLGELGRLDL